MSPERQRDALGRPLPADVDPALVVPGVPIHATLSDEEAWSEAAAYLESGQPFHAHEVFELRWRMALQADKAAWQALAQWGAALTHEARGNPRGASAVAARALANLDASEGIPTCIDASLVRESCARLVLLGGQTAQ